MKWNGANDKHLGIVEIDVSGTVTMTPHAVLLERRTNRTEEQKLANSIDDRLSEELVFALVGPVGSGVSTAAKHIAEILSRDYDYAVAPVIKPSDMIKAEARRIGKSTIRSQPLSTYIDEMQTAGNELRQKFGPNYLAEKAVERIVKFRHEQNGYGEHGISLPGRRAYIIDSIKNIEELTLLRQIYRDTLCVVGVFAPDLLRRERLINDGAAADQVQKVIDRDVADVPTFGQMTRKVFIESDFFLCNDRKEEELRGRIARFLEMIFDVNIHTPTKAESAMYSASAAMASSACMSRQVGAAIVSKSGELISVGWNDVPKFGGRLYTEEDQFVLDKEKQSIQDADHRCFKWSTRICHNETRRTEILNNIARRISGNYILD